ncbi:MAG: putative toxin-antitoxin system toxin component, PIN family [Candidatus Electrothrix sp. AUS1_2]|nr:putative toxin-antitoxin system toxin component, PIN family [Candidatus Electrothrix sp. AUS1_2]
MKPVQIVIDTNVFVSALRNDTGASFYLLSRIGKGEFATNVSVPLIMEYEAVATRLLKQTNLNPAELNDILDYICSVSSKHKISYLWRPFLKDPKDDLVLELAVKAGSQYIITFNKKDFSNISKFGIMALTPWEFLIKRGLL